MMNNYSFMVTDVRRVSSKNFDPGNLKCKGLPTGGACGSRMIHSRAACAFRANARLMHARSLAGLKTGSG